MFKNPVHPGEMLADELAELGITPTELARQLCVPSNRIIRIIQGKHAITGETALLLGHWFRTSAVFWMNLQTHYDMPLAGLANGRKIARLLQSPPII